MLRIDSHQHFWNYDRERDSWINDQMQVLQRDFLPADLEPLLQQEDIAGCIAVQADHSEEENAFLLSCAEQYSFIKGIVGWVDLQRDGLEERLRHYGGRKQIKGFRHILQSESDRALMLRPRFMQGISLLGRYHFSYDILIHPDQLLFARELALNFPGQTFILDHIGKPAIRQGADPEWEEHIRLLGACHNVYCKISGIITEAAHDDWNAESLVSFIHTAIAAFSPGRVLFGSDWPVCLLAGSYAQVCSLATAALQRYTTAEQQGFWGHNAIKCYRLELQTTEL